MSVLAESPQAVPAGDSAWYVRTADDVCAALGVDVSVGRSAEAVAQSLKTSGPNALDTSRRVRRTALTHND